MTEHLVVSHTLLKLKIDQLDLVPYTTGVFLQDSRGPLYFCPLLLPMEDFVILRENNLMLVIGRVECSKLIIYGDLKKKKIRRRKVFYKPGHLVNE